MIATINALGDTIHPYYLFPRVNFRRHRVDGPPTGFARTAAPNGWVNEETFPDFMKHFSKCSKRNPVLRIIDNHSSHISLVVPSL